MAVGIRHEDRKLGKTDGQQKDEYDRGPGVVIRGVCGGDAFIVAEVLIYADTLGGEEAIRAWLDERGIHVKQARRTTARGKNRARLCRQGEEVVDHVPWLFRARRQLKAWTFATWPLR